MYFDIDKVSKSMSTLPNSITYCNILIEFDNIADHWYSTLVIHAALKNIQKTVM